MIFEKQTPISHVQNTINMIFKSIKMRNSDSEPEEVG
jgi:hypothetical protein